MESNEDHLAVALSAVHTSHRLDVVGRRGSGRSYFLTQLDKALRHDGWETLLVRGVSPLKGFPLTVLGFAGLDISRDQRSNFRAAFAGIRERAEHGTFAILVDDLEQLDDASWGVIAAARKELHLPIVVTRLSRAVPASAALTTTVSDTTLTVALDPLSYDDIEQLVENRLGGPASGQLVSRIFAKSAGLPGIAHAIVDAADSAGQLTQIDGAWSARGELWGPLLQGLMETHLVGLSLQEREALELLSWAGIVDIDTAGLLIGWEVLESLEDATLLDVVSSGSRQLVVVVPPLLTEHFRHQPPSARRVRLARQISERLAPEQQRPSDDGTRAATGPFVTEPDALFIRLLQDKQAITRRIAQANWEHAQTLDAALDYLNQLIDTSAPYGVIDAAFDVSSRLGGDDEKSARFTMMRAAWLIRAHHDHETADQIILDVRPKTGPYEGILDSGLTILGTRLGEVPDDVEARLPIKDTLPTIVRGRMLEARTHAHVARGELTLARASFDAVKNLEGYDIRPISLAMGALIEFGRGNLHEAAQEALTLFTQAREMLDPNALRTAAYVAACAFSAVGKFKQVGDILDTVIAMGEPSVPLVPETLALYGLGSMVAYHTRRHIVGHHTVSDLTVEPELDGLLPGMHWAWARAHQLAIQGEYVAASDLLWTESHKQWERGGRLAGAFGMLNAVEMNPDAARLAVAAERTAEIDSGLADVHCRYVTALVSRDGHQMEDAAARLEQQGRVGPAALAYRFAETWLAAVGDAQGARLAGATRSRLLDLADADDYDYRQFRTTRMTLTEREQEIGRLVARGLTNPQIATQLVLSTRTVESHLHNLTKKLGAATRDDVAQRLADYVDGTLID